MIVGYPDTSTYRVRGGVARKRPLVFDAVLSLEDELVEVRRRFRPRSTAATVLRVVDSRALRLPTSSSAARAPRRSTSSSSAPEAAEVIFLGADEDVFCETWSPTYPFSASTSPTPPPTSCERRCGAARTCRCGSRCATRSPQRARHRVRARGHRARQLPRVASDPAGGLRRARDGRARDHRRHGAARELLTDGESALLVRRTIREALADAFTRLAATTSCARASPRGEAGLTPSARAGACSARAGAALARAAT